MASEKVMARPLLLRLGHQPLPPRATSAIGAKAANLHTLIRQKRPVPATWVVTSAAFTRWRAGDAAVLAELRAALAPVVAAGSAYAVRSSADVEDGREHSYAGQFRTLLGVAGLDAVLEAVRDVWRSATSQQAEAYREHRAGAPAARPPLMAVLVQEMVCPRISGVAFSRNPVTGLNEVVVEAVEGSGEGLVQDGITPARWVWRRGRWPVRPESSQAPDALLEQVVAETNGISKAWGRPVDLEWVWDGDRLWWVQLREITSLGSLTMYSNWVAREVLPGQIKPLVWSVNVPLVNGAWVRLFTELVGDTGIDAEQLARAFHYRAYFNMSEIGRIFDALGVPRSSLELLAGIGREAGEQFHFRPTAATLRHLPRMARFVLAKSRFSRRVGVFLPAATARAEAFDAASLAGSSDAALLATVDEHYAFVQEIAYFDIVVPLLMQLYRRLLVSRLGRAGFEPETITRALRVQIPDSLDPNAGLVRLNRTFMALQPATRDRLARAPAAALAQEAAADAAPFLDAMRAFLRQFGHLSDSGNDFSVPPWRESPALILRLAAEFQPPAESEPGIPFDALPLPALRRALLRSLHRRASAFALYREQVSSLYTQAYGRFRDLYLEIGRRLVARNVLQEVDEIFYLRRSEIGAAVKADLATALSATACARRDEMAACRSAALPDVIYGEAPPPLRDAAAEVLTGAATSPGYYQGRARVVAGLADFSAVEKGDVLVIPWSDVGWTPLFTRAGAVVAESGGVLSHSSIVAREYGIPAVVAVSGACRALRDAWVSVDGYRGEVVILREPASAAGSLDQSPSGAKEPVQ